MSDKGDVFAYLTAKSTEAIAALDTVLRGVHAYHQQLPFLQERMAALVAEVSKLRTENAELRGALAARNAVSAAEKNGSTK